MSKALYLYGIFPAPGPRDLELEGLDQQPVQTQTIDGFVFLYSEAKQNRYLASRRNLLGHERVLEEAMQAGYRTLLPLQFGLTIDTWDTVSQQLTSPHSSHLAQLFEKLDGHREVGVKVFWESDREIRLLMSENADLQSERDRLDGKSLSMDEIVRIGQAIEKSMGDRKQQIISAFQAALNPLSIDRTENDGLSEQMVYNAAYLIPWETEAAFSEQVEILDQQFQGRLKIRYNDFTAPYNFAQFDPLN
jgi:hypothetical protein